MEQFLERLEKEKLFASGGGGGGEGHEEEGSLSRTEVNLALYGLGLDEIEGGEDEVAAEAGMIEEERRRKERRVMLERERRRKEGQSKEEETTVSFTLFWIGSFLVVFAPFVARSLTRTALTGALNSLVYLHFAFFFSIRFKRKPWRIESSNGRLSSPRATQPRKRSGETGRLECTRLCRSVQSSWSRSRRIGGSGLRSSCREGEGGLNGSEGSSSG
ncbi:hypothetical protein BDY24DRAFT_403821 [Mrakia frigida]|uniref:uncharacterized protein n=1 Tax=Mrakia frigida TaxID=29902 RepID=UPI003FCC2268